PGDGYATATDLADWLVRTLKMPSRDAHHVTGRIVARASKDGVALHELPLKAMQEIEPKITAEALKVLSVEASVKSRISFGGTAPRNVLAQAKGWAKRLEKQRKEGFLHQFRCHFMALSASPRPGNRCMVRPDLGIST